MHSNNYSLEVLVNGRPVQEYYKDSKSFIEAREGTEYTLRFRNNSWKRVLAVFSVDGVEVLKGKAASQADNGYIVDAFYSIEIKGYRIDEETVAAFKFSSGTQSYAVVVGAEKTNPKTGETHQEKTDRNNGVIGVRVFEEDVPDHNYKEQYKPLPVIDWSGGRMGRVFYPSFGVYTSSLSSSSTTGSLGFSPASGYGTFTFDNRNQSSFKVAPTCSGDGTFSSLYTTIKAAEIDAPSFYSAMHTGCAGTLAKIVTGCASLISPNFDLGTSWGSKTTDKIREVSFKKVEAHTDIVVYYASRASLESYGIDFSRTKQIFSWPEAFEDKKQYCKLPPGYKV